jgi:hypothetical protein
MKNNRIWSIQSSQSLCGHCAHSLELSEQPSYMVSQSLARNLGIAWHVSLRSERKVSYELRCSGLLRIEVTACGIMTQKSAVLSYFVMEA